MTNHPRAQWKPFKDLIGTADLPALGPGPRANRFSLPDLNQKLDRFFAGTGLAPDLKPPLESAALLWHDYLDESHAISQRLATPDGSFLHGIMHRREPDYGNAKYWFRRVGKHPCFPDIADKATRLLDSNRDKEWAAKLVLRGNWDPFAFVDACEVAAQWPSSDQRVQTLKAIQEIEFDCLLAHWLAR